MNFRITRNSWFPYVTQPSKGQPLLGDGIAQWQAGIGGKRRAPRKERLLEPENTPIETYLKVQDT